MKRSLPLILAALLAGASVARAADTELVIQHQGFLVKADETAVTESVQLKVSFFDKETGGNDKWNDTWTVTPLAGRYSVQLGRTEGNHKALSAGDLSGDRWLAVTVGTQELAPRIKLSPVPLALRATFADKATDAETLAGKPATDYALKTDVPAKSADADKLDGLDSSAFALKDDVPTVATDALKLGGVAAEQYALKSDVPAKSADADKLDGQDSTAFALANHNHDDLYVKKTGAVTLESATVTGALSAGAVTATSVTAPTVTADKVTAKSFGLPPVTFNGTHVYSHGPRPPYFFVKETTTILQESSTSGQFDAGQINSGCVFKEGATFYLFYGAYDGSVWNGFGLATATNPKGPFTRFGTIPVLQRSSNSGQGLDLSDFYRCSIVKDGSTYKMYYSGYSRSSGNIWRVFLATSTSLTSGWTKQGLVVDPRSSNPGAFDRDGAYSPAALFEDGKVLLTYAGINSNWDNSNYQPATWAVRGVGAQGWTVGAAIATDSSHKQFTPFSLLPTLRGQVRGHMWSAATGWDTASAHGVAYTSWDRYSKQPGTIMKIGDLYVMFYGADDGAWNQIGAAYSYDGQSWTRDGNAVLHADGPGPGADSYVTSPMVLIDGNTMYMYYVTYDYAVGKNRIRVATMRF